MSSAFYSDGNFEAVTLMPDHPSATVTIRLPCDESGLVNRFSFSICSPFEG